MTNDTDKTFEQFTVIRGGLYAKRSPLAAVERAKLKAQEKASRLMHRRGYGEGIRDRGIQCVAAGITNPLKEPVKLIHRYRWAGVPMDEAEAAVIEPLVIELRLAYDRDEQQPAA